MHKTISFENSKYTLCFLLWGSWVPVGSTHHGEENWLFCSKVGHRDQSEAVFICMFLVLTQTFPSLNALI